MRDNHSNDNNKIIRSAEAHTYNIIILYLCKTAQHEAHESGIIIKRNALHVSKHVTESIRNIAR